MYDIPNGAFYSGVLWAAIALSSSIPNYSPVILLAGGQTTKGSFMGSAVNYTDGYSYDISGELVESTGALGVSTTARITITNIGEKSFSVSGAYSCCIGATGE